MERSELIKALGNAFAGEKQSETTQIENATAGDKTVLRLTKTDNDAFYNNMRRKYNDFGAIDMTISLLMRSGDHDGEQAGIYWKAAYAACINNEDEERLARLITNGQEVIKRLTGTASHTPQRALVYMFAKEAIV